MARPFIHYYFMRPVGHDDLPTLSFFDDQQVYPLVPRPSLFPLATISLAIHFANLISFVLPVCLPLWSLSRPFLSFLWHQSIIV